MRRPTPLLMKLLGVACGAFATCAVVAGCQRAGTAPLPNAIPKVTVQKPIRRVITEYDLYVGRTQAVETVEIRARVDGYLDQIAFEEGQEVEAGQLLFVIDPRPYEAALRRSKAEVDRYKAQLALADVEFRRAETLLRKNAGTREEFDKAAAARQVSEAGLEAAEAQVKQEELNLDFTRIAAPIAGRISRALVTKGNLVIGSVGNPTLLTTIVRMDPMYVYFDVDERRLLRYQQQVRENRIRGDVDATRYLKAARIPVRMGLATDTGYPYSGVLDFAENKVDARTGSIQVRAVFENQDRRLTPGLFARIRVESARPYEALLVPEVALGTDQGQKFVLVVNDQNEALYRRVKLGTLTDDNYRVITEGVSASDRVVVNGMLRIRPGMKVEAEEVAAPADAGASQAPPPEESSGPKAEPMPPSDTSDAPGEAGGTDR